MEINTPSPTLTPMMAQWHACKEHASDAILLFRLGDFYEAFYEDAHTISKELDLTLTKRQDIPMAGVPFHTCDTYVDRLIAKGYRVAIAEQMEDPKQKVGIVKREIVRVITPGTVVNSSLLSEKTANYLAAITQLNKLFGLCLIDITTAAFYVMEFEDSKSLLDELSRLRPKELVALETFKKDKEFLNEIKQLFHPTINFKPVWYFDHQNALQYLLKHFRVHSLDGFGLKAMTAALMAAGSLLIYLKEELNLPIDHLKQIQRKQFSSYLSIDRMTQRNLELFQSLNERQKETSLLYLLDETFTPMGARLLREWLIHPLTTVLEIKKRQDAISFFFSQADISGELICYLKKVRDLERMMMRIETGFATPRDLAGLKTSLEQIPLISVLLKPIKTELIAENTLSLTNTDKITQLLQNALMDEPPIRLNEGGYIRHGYHDELDELRMIKKKSHDWIAEYQASLKEKTGIKTLKIGYTKAFGYYIETTRSASEKIPESFQRKQTLVNNERYITEELKDFEHKMLTADERILSLEVEIFHKIRLEVAKQSVLIKNIASAIATLDCLHSLALVCKKRNYVRPIVDESDHFEILQGRHPVIEATLPSETFIPNDIHLGNEKRLSLITGPNMAGKSTYIRQAALIAIMAQMGSFVPAKKAHIGIIDKIFSRIGASDDLASGQSTFMVEMTETANILNNATKRSLVILDEIGRGTSTYDGISIAWAVAEYLLLNPEKSAKTLFATHYFELTELEQKIPGVINCNVAVQETDKGIIFLRKITPGSADKSYGIHVARLAGIPHAVITRAEERLNELEKQSAQKIKTTKKKEDQYSLFSPLQTSHPIIEELKKIDPEHLTPIEALQLLLQWKSKFL